VHSPPGKGTRIQAEIPYSPRTTPSWGLATLQHTGHHDSQLEPQV
jgi:hypothetical protein